MRKKIFLICTVLFTAFTGRAQSIQFKPDQFTSRMNSSVLADISKPPAIYQDTLPVAVYDRWNEHVAYQTGQGGPAPGYSFKSIHNFIKVGINHDTALHVPAYKYMVSLSILTYDPLTGGGNTPLPGNPVSVTRVVSYDPDSLRPYQDMDVFHFQGNLKFQVIVTGVYDISNPNTAPQPVPRNQLAKNFFIECEVQTQRNDDLLNQVVPECVISPDKKSLKVEWMCTAGSVSYHYCKASDIPVSTRITEVKPIMYELEWTYIDDYSVSVTPGGPSVSYRFSNPNTAIPYDFRKNSTRIQTDKRSFSIPLLYQHGAVIFRVRAFRPDPNTGFKDIYYLPWSLPDSGAVTPSNNCFPGQGVLITTPHMNDSLNWQYTINFAEEGKYKHVIRYFDGSYKERQTQTKINTNDSYTIAVDKIYDYEGRPSLTTLPVPFRQQNPGYRPDIAIKAPGQPVSAADIDRLGCSLPDSLPPLASSSPAHIYYSGLNPDTADFHKFIPHAKGYPFVQTVFSPDNTHKVLWQGAAGYELQAFKKPTRYEYVRISPKELDRLAGTEAGSYEFYPKEVVTDPNGQASFTIFNPSGQVVATGLQGLPDTAGKPIDLLPNYAAGDSVCSDLLRGLTQEKLPGNLRAEHTFYVDIDGRNSFKYSGSVPAFSPGCGKYLWSGARLDIKVFNDCGVMTDSVTATVGKDSILTANVPAYFASANKVMNIPKGKYQVTKELKFSGYDIRRQADSFIIKNQPGCYNDAPFFIKQAVEAAEFPCTDSGGTDPCAMKQKQMIKELYPDRKYGRYSKKSDSSFLLAGSNSIFSFVIDSNAIGNGTLIFRNGTTPKCQVSGSCATTYQCTGGNGCGCATGAHPFSAPCCSDCLTQQCECIQFGFIRKIDTTFAPQYLPMSPCTPAGPLTDSMKMEIDPCYDYGLGNQPYPFPRRKFSQLCSCDSIHTTGWIGHVALTQDFYLQCGASSPFDFSNTLWKPYVTNWLFVRNGATGKWSPTWCMNTSTWSGTYDVSSEYPHGCSQTVMVPVSFDTSYTPLAGSIYMRYQAACLSLPASVWHEGRQYTGIAQLPADTFIRIFNDTIAAALLPLHPEYCKLQACDDGGFLRELENISDFRDALAAGRFTLNDLIQNDPVYTQRPPAEKPSIHARLSTVPNLGKGVDTYALETAYCGAGDMASMQGCARSVYAQEISSFTFINDAIKQAYFTILKSLYLSNRNLIVQQQTDRTGNSCPPCGGVRMSLTGDPVFEPVFDASGNIAHDAIPGWMRDLFDSTANGTYSGTGIPPQVLDSINRINQVKLESEADAVMKNLGNCSLNPSLLQQIRNGILSAGAPVTPLKVKNSILSAGIAPNDLCHPFLVNYNLFDNTGKEDDPFDCGQASVYNGLSSFLARQAVKNALKSPGTDYAIPGLDVSNDLEMQIRDLYNTSAVTVRALPVAVPVTLANATVQTLYYTELIVLPTGGPALPQHKILHFYLNADLSSFSDFSASSALCLNEKDEALKEGYISLKSAALQAQVRKSPSQPWSTEWFYVWNDKLDLMKQASDASIAAALNCKELQLALESFKADKSAYGYDDAFNHPLTARTLTGYLNHKLKRNFTFEDYYQLMSGCAATDKVRLHEYQAAYKITFSTDATANTFIAGLSNPNIVTRRIKQSGQVILHLDLHTVPKDSILWHSDRISSLATAAGAGKAYLPHTGTMIYAKNSFASLPPSTTSLFGSYTTQTLQVMENGSYVNYTCYSLNNTYATPYAEAQSLAAIRTALKAHPGAFAVYHAALLRSGDYNTPAKQAYLNNVYGIVSGQHSDITDSISIRHLKQHVSAFAGKELSYDDPYYAGRKTHLYVYDHSSSDPGFIRLRDSVFSTVKNHAGGRIFYSAPFTDVPSPLGKVSVIRKVNGAYWYRYFNPKNRLYNTYLQLPPYTRHPAGNYTLSTLKPTVGKDSVYFFDAYLVYSGDTIVCKGYTDFSIGHCQSVENVLLQEGTGFTLDSLDCEHDQLLSAITQGKAAYQLYFDSTGRSIRDSMIRFLVDHTRDTLTLCAREAKYQYTLYYYDRAGNLTKTIPPQGVQVITNNNLLNQVASYRDNPSPNISGQPLTSHKKASVYRYNAQNQVYYQQTPDGGAVYFFYDAAGRPVFSQNSRQRPAGLYSYTLYDRQGRPVETGEVKLGCTQPSGGAAGFDTTHCNFTINGQSYSSIHPPYVEHSYNSGLYPMDTLIKYIRTQSRTDVVLTLYDTAGKDLGALTGEHLSPQENLLRRVSAVLYFPVIGNTHIPSAYQYASRNPYFGTYYSYDMQGNVKTVSYEYQPLGPLKQKYKRVDYEYDVLSGKINQLSYNRGKADQFYHRYQYDADNRLVSVHTSKEGIIWTRDARYSYYAHGPLARTVLGDRPVQSVEYAYTINGWLKAINGDVLRPDKDMGRNGIASGMIAGVAGDTAGTRDVIAHALDYFRGDYQAITAGSVTSLPGPDKSLYNGNIARQTTSLEGLGNMQRSYRYDQLHRLTGATNVLIDEASLQAVSSPSGLYRSAYSYDRDGNLLTLQRYTGLPTPALLDNFTYSYSGSGTDNRLLRVNELSNAVPGGTDLKPGQSGTNYEYDGTGNLTRDRQAGLRISWLPGGKVHLIHDTVRNTFLKFTYDGAGNRIFKDHIKKISVHEEAHKGEYYVRDGSGHILAVYESSSTYSPLSIVTAATGAVASAPDFGAFIVREVASRSSFRPGFIAKAVEALPSWTEQQTGSRPVSFYLERDEELYSRMLFSSADYFDALRDYEWEGGENVFASSLSDAWAEAAPLLAEILSHESEGVALLTHFSSVIPGDRARELWDEADLSYEEDKAAENAVSLFAYVQAHKLEGKISQDMTGIFIADKEASDGVNTRSFYTALIGDDLVFHSPYLREAGGMFEYQLSGILYNHGPRSALSAFFDGWEPARDRFNENTAPDRRLSVVYDSNPPEQISSFVSASGPDLLSEVIAGMADLPALEYAGKVRQHFPMADLSAATVALSLAADTMTLTEHHLYGLSRIGVQRYDTAYRNTYRPDPDAGVVNRLSGVRPWYSGALGDYIEGGYVDPWGHMLSGMSFEHRVRGHRHYEVTDHLGNVLATVLDRRTGQRAGGSGDLYAYWKADVSGVSDYYPGGMLMPGRYKMMNNDTALYRFGWNTHERVNEIAGVGNHTTALFGEFDTRTGRRWNPDPKPIPEESVYAVNRNNPIQFSDPDGDFPVGKDDPASPSPAGILYEAYLGLDAAVFNTMSRIVEWTGNGKPGVSVRKETEYGSDGAVLGNRIVEKAKNSAGREALEAGLDLFAAIPGKPNAQSLGLFLTKPVVGKQNAIQVVKQIAAKTGSSWVYGAFKTEAKWAGQLSKRGWTAEQITEAVTKGKSFDAVNMVNKANSATRYVHPTTGQSVVIDNVTKELLHVGGPGFKY